MSEDEIILTHILHCRTIDLVLNKPALTPSQQKQFEQYKFRRQAGEPLQYILGTCNFMGLELTVNPSVLVPRPETEQLVDAALKHLTMSSPNVEDPAKGGGLVGDPNMAIRILDLGTGSGNIAIALAKFLPQSKIVSIDISAQAIEVARANAQKHGVENCIEFIQGDIFTSLRGARKGDAAISERTTNSVEIASPAARNDMLFDLVISNPPYIPTNQLSSLPQDVRHEPAKALDGGEDGLSFYRIIIKYTPCLLRSGACLMMEFGDGQAEAVKKLVEAQKAFSGIEIFQDLAGRDRIIKAVVILRPRLPC